MANTKNRTARWVKEEKGFKHKNNKCNNALIVVVFPPKIKSFLFNSITI